MMKLSEFFTVGGEAVLADGSFGTVCAGANTDTVFEDIWTVLFFYPADYTFVCPTELKALNEAMDQFIELNTCVWGVSTDSIYVHSAWREDVFDEPFGVLLVDDRNRMLSDRFECLDNETGMSYRCTVILDPQGRLRSYSIQDNGVGRNTDEILRTLAALQSIDASGGKELACANWQPGDELLNPGE